MMKCWEKALGLTVLLLFCLSNVKAQSPVGYTVEEIVIEGNKVTRSEVLLRELSFSLHDFIQADDLDQVLAHNETRLLNSELFLTAELTAAVDGNALKIYIKVQERWYIFPFPHLSLGDRNFNVWWEEHNGDLHRLIYGLDFYWSNFTGRNQDLYLRYRDGFSQNFAFSYLIRSLDRFYQHGLKIDLDFKRERLLPYMTSGNKEVFFEGDDFLLRDFQAALVYTNRVNYFRQHQSTLKLKDIKIEEELQSLNPMFLKDGSKHERFLSFGYSFLANHRNYKAYPTKGYYWQAGFTKEGIGILGNTDRFLLETTGQWYQPLSQMLFFSQHLSGRLAWPKNRAFYFDQALGSDQDFVRGYELYIMDGPDYLLSRTNLRWKFAEFKIDIPLINWKQIDPIPIALYLKAFTDFAFVAGNRDLPSQPFNDTWLLGFGPGIDLVTYYDWVIRLEYTTNRRRENGLFLHFAMDLETN